MSRRSLSVTAVLGALALALGATPATPAGAANPGGNGARSYVHDGVLVIDGTAHVGVYQPAPRDLYVSQASWAPDGRRMALTTADTEHLYVYEPAARTLRLLGRADPDSKPSFSPDGRGLAVARDGDIHVVDVASGATVRNLTPSTTSTREANPSWSPTNSGIAYDASDGIRVRSVTGGPSRLFKRDGRYPDYSPDGSRLSYIDRPTGRLHYAQRDGSGTVRTAVDVVAAAWSPDGQRFVVTGNTNANCLVTSLTGRIVERLAEAVCVSPSWQPLPR